MFNKDFCVSYRGVLYVFYYDLHIVLRSDLLRQISAEEVGFFVFGFPEHRDAEGCLGGHCLAIVCISLRVVPVMPRDTW